MLVSGFWLHFFSFFFFFPFLFTGFLRLGSLFFFFSRWFMDLVAFFFFFPFFFTRFLGLGSLFFFFFPFHIGFLGLVAFLFSFFFSLDWQINESKRKLQAPNPFKGNSYTHKFTCTKLVQRLQAPNRYTHRLTPLPPIGVGDQRCLYSERKREQVSRYWGRVMGKKKGDVYAGMVLKQWVRWVPQKV